MIDFRFVKMYRVPVLIIMETMISDIMKGTMYFSLKKQISVVLKSEKLSVLE